MVSSDANAVTNPVSRHQLAWAALFCVGAALLLAYPALGGGFLVNPNSDQYIAGYSFREFAAQSLKSGNGFPLWNPYQFGGMPYVAAMHGDIFYPTFLLRMIMPTDIAMTWGFVIHLFLAGFFTAGFLRASGLSLPSASIGGVAYMLAGPVAAYASPGHDGKLFVSALLPAALWCAIRGLRDGRAAAWGLLALVVGLGVLSPHPQLLQYMLLATGAYSLFLVLSPASVPGSDPGVAPRSKPRYARLGFALIAVVVGGAIGAIQYLPVMEYVPWSPRSGGKGYEYATSYSLPLEETINFYLPQFSGILNDYWGRNGIHFHSEYLGVVALVLAGLAFGGGAGNRNRRHAWFWLGTFVISMLWALGGSTPFYQLIYALVPGTKYFRAPSTILYIVGFSTAVLAAFGAERVLAGKAGVRYAIIWCGIALSIGLIATAGGFTGLALSMLGDQTGDAIMANAPNVTMGAWRSAFFVFVVAAVIVGVARNMLSGKAAGFALLGVLALDLWSIERRYWMFSERADKLFATDSIVQYLQNDKEPGRVIAIALSNNIASHDPFILGDALMHLRVRGVLGYHGNELGRYQTLTGKADGMQSLANPNFWALTNARYLYTNLADAPFPGSKLVAGPVRNAAGTMTFLYRMPGDQPAAWVVPMIVKAGDASTLATVLNPLFNVRRAVIFDSASTAAAQPATAALPEPLSTSVKFSRYEAGAIDMTLDGTAPAGSALVVSENYYPGWQAEVDGKPVEVSRADYTIMGIPLPPNARAVSLRFVSAPYERGKLITLGAVLLAVLASVAGYVADRRKPTGLLAA
ncbi:MAG: YfhO family protein [Phycisphaerae bacterium]|nr:YfhO family protein [Gemmatimonadaceae bacterium]